MHMVFQCTVKKKIYNKTFAIKYVFSHLYTYLATGNFMHGISIMEKNLIQQIFKK